MIIDKQKKTLAKTNTKLSQVEKELEENKLLIVEKDQEILYLRNYLNTLKADRNNFFYF